nr:mucin-17-like isoform X1 [Danio rerio]|eukprot:XP_017213515.2 mucin-17-like isoform X1 [Danio rerio]
MDQGWIRFPLLVVVLLFWMNADGYSYSTSPNADQWLGQPSEKTFLPLVVQSSVAEAPVTGVLLEEVVSSLPKNRPKFNLLQVVKGGVSSSSDSTPQTLSLNTPSSASLPVDQSGKSGSVSFKGSSGSTTAYATSGSGQIVFAQRESGSFSSNAGVSGQSTNDQSSPSLSSSASQGTTYGLTSLVQGTNQFAPGSSSSYATISLPKYVSQLKTGPSSKPFMTVYGTQTLQGSTTYGGKIQTTDTASQFVKGSTSPDVVISLSQDVSSQSAVPSSKQITSVYSTQTGSSAPFTLQELFQGQDSTSKFVSGSLTPSVAVSLAQGVSSQSALPSSKRITSVYSTQTGSSAPFTLQRLVQAPDMSTVISGSLTPSEAILSAQGVPSYSTVPSSKKTITSDFSTQTGSSAPFTFQESTTYGGLIQAQDTSQSVLGSSTPYVAVSIPQVVTSQSAMPSSKQTTSVYSTQTGSSAPFTLQELLQGQDSTSKVDSVSSTPFVSVSLPQVFTSQSATVPSPKKPITSVYSTHRLVQAPGVPHKVVSGSLTPSVAVSLTQGVPSQSTVPSSKKTITSVYSSQKGSSAPFTLQRLVQAPDTTSTVISESLTPSKAILLTQGVPSQSAVPSSKTITSVYSTQTGSSAPFTLQRLVQAPDTSTVISGSLTPSETILLAQGVPRQSAVPSSKKTITSVHSTQTGSSAPFTFQEITANGGLIQAQDTSQSVLGISTPYVAVSIPQVITSQSAVPSSKQTTSVYSTQTGSSAPFTLQELLQGQDSTSKVDSVSSTPFVSVSLPQVFTSQSATVPNSKKPITSVLGTHRLVQAPDVLHKVVSGSLTPSVAVSLAQVVPSQSAVPSSKKTITSVYSTQTGSSAPFTLQRLVQAPDTTSTVISGSLTPSETILLAQGVPSQSAVPSSKKTITSVYSTQTGSSAPFTLQELFQGQDSTSKVVSGSLTPSVDVSLAQVVPSQSAVPSSKKTITSVYSTQTGSSAPFTLQRLVQAPDTTSTVISGSLTPSETILLAQGVPSQSAVPSSKKTITSVYSTQTGSSAPFTLQELFQGQDSTSKVVSGSLTPSVDVSLAQVVPSQSAVPSSKKTITSVYSTQTGSSAPFTLQRFVQAPDTTSTVISGSLTPSETILLAQGVPSQSTVPSSKKTITSVHSTQTGSSAPITFQESTTYGGTIQAQGTSQSVSGSSTPFVAVSMPQGVTSQSAVPSSKQITSVYSTQIGSSAPFTLQSIVKAQDTSKVISEFSAPSVAVALAQAVPSQSAVPSSKQITSVFKTQQGSSAPFTFQGGTTYGVPIQAQDTTSQFVSRSSTPVVAVSLPQDVVSPSITVPSSKKPITSVYGTLTGSSALFTLQGLLQGKESTSQVVSVSSPYVAVSLPQGITSQSTIVPSSKKTFTSVYGTQTESSTPFVLQGTLESQDSTSQVVSVSSTPYVSVSLPQDVTSQSAVPSSKRITSVYSTQTGSSAPFTLQRLVQAQDATSEIGSGSSTPSVVVTGPRCTKFKADYLCL